MSASARASANASANGSAICTHKGCGQVLTGSVAIEPCIFHPGEAVFHEGLKGTLIGDGADCRMELLQQAGAQF